jgi:FAD/FMN-containing dehydrogenase
VPACIITPSSADDISQALKIIKQYQCIFAVKSGGHAMFSGASNAPSGITIDLKKLNDVVPDEDGLVTRVWTGNRWANVYKVL